MLVKAVLHRDKQGKFGIFLCANKDGRPCIEKVVALDVEDSRHLLEPWDIVVEVNGIDMTRILSIISVKEVISDSKETCTIEVRREPLPTPAAIGMAVKPNSMQWLKNPMKQMQERAELERKHKAEEQRKAEEQHARDEERKRTRAEDRRKSVEDKQQAAALAAATPVPDLMNLALESSGPLLMAELEAVLAAPPAAPPAPTSAPPSVPTPALQPPSIAPPPGPPPSHVPFFPSMAGMQPGMMVPGMGLQQGMMMPGMGLQQGVGLGMMAPPSHPSALGAELAAPMRPHNAPPEPEEMRKQAVLTAFKQVSEPLAEQQAKPGELALYGGLVKL